MRSVIYLVSSKYRRILLLASLILLTLLATVPLVTLPATSQASITDPGISSFAGIQHTPFAPPPTGWPQATATPGRTPISRPTSTTGVTPSTKRPPTPVPTPPGPAPTPTPVLPPTPVPTPAPGQNLLANPGFEGYGGWCVWNNQNGQYGCDGSYFNSFIESWIPSHSGTYHRVHWSGSSSYDITTYQAMAAPVSGNYYASVWVTTGCDTTGTWFFIKNTDTGTEYDVHNIPECYQAWTQITIGPAWFNKGQTIAFEMRSKNNPNQWVRFDDAALWYN